MTTPTRARRAKSRQGAEDATLRQARRVLALLFGPAAARPLTVRYWDGSVDGPATEPVIGSRASAFTLVLRSPGSLRGMLLPPSELRLGEAFVRGLFDIEGDGEAAIALERSLGERIVRPATVLRLIAELMRLPRDRAPVVRRHRPAAARRTRAHSRARDAGAVRSHYDIGNEFYTLWLDRRLVYSCAYFETGGEDLDTAQTAKLEHICRKVRLRPGERLLDVGCGWGGLILYAAERYGVNATGITLSEPQAAVARERIVRAGLADRCRVEVCDYRALTAGHPFDKVVSVGMIEHVGRSQLARYFAALWHLTKPGGLFLNHGIVRMPEPAGFAPAIGRRLWREGQFIDRYVFPDGQLIPLADTLYDAERAGFEVRDVESLREHYALTLRHWVARLEAAAPMAVHLVGEEVYRIWWLYMTAAAEAFASGRLNLAQSLLAKPDYRGQVDVPRTRADLYVRPATSMASEL